MDESIETETNTTGKVAIAVTAIAAVAVVGAKLVGMVRDRNKSETNTEN